MCERLFYYSGPTPLFLAFETRLCKTKNKALKSVVFFGCKEKFID